MPRIKNWKKLSETEWYNTKTKVKLYVAKVSDMMGIKTFGYRAYATVRRLYYNQEIVAQSPEFTHKKEAIQWCLKYMKKGGN